METPFFFKMAKVLDLTTKRFGKLVVIQRHPENTKAGKARWICQCDCGNDVTVTGGNLQSGFTQSCGCFQLECVKTIAEKYNVTHGLSHTPEYETYKCMLKRCCDEKNRNYADYGGRGITVCDEWKNSFEAFYRDMGPRPSPEHSIDRRDNNKGYSKDNCRWATKEEQANNKRNNLFYEYKGEIKPLGTWCRELGLNRKLVYTRIREYGWSFSEAITPIEDLSIEYDGTRMTLQHWCDLLILKHNHVYLRILRGEKFEDIVCE